jgi:hypothetical protein
MSRPFPFTNAVHKTLLQQLFQGVKEEIFFFDFFKGSFWLE